MITTSPEEFLVAFRKLAASPRRRASVPQAVFLVAPDAFAVSDESARDNAYMRAGTAVDRERALAQHRDLASLLHRIGVPVLVLPGRDGQPDGVYPNNVFSIARGRCIVGSMRHEVRRREAAREDLRSLWTEALGLELVDLSDRGLVAELTGPLVIDRPLGVGFCGMTGRVDDAGCAAMHQAFGLDLTFRFDLREGEYHTNLVMALLAGRLCVLHPSSFLDPSVPDALRAAYPGACLELSDDEKRAFAGNCIAVTERDVLMSETAHRRLRPESRRTFESAGFRLHSVVVDELEKGGGSVRCLIGEVYP